MGPSRHMVVIRLYASKYIFWNFRSPEKTCRFPSVMQATRGTVKGRGHVLLALSQAVLDKHRTPLRPSLLSEAHLPFISLVIPFFTQQPS